jgi:hypothetical protein
VTPAAAPAPREIPGGGSQRAQGARTYRRSAADWLLLLQAVRVVALERWLVARGRHGSRLRRAMMAETLPPVVDGQRAARLAWAVQRAAALRPIGAACLARSLALWSLMTGSGLSARVRVGVRVCDGRVQAHAWVESGGVVVGDRQDVASLYAPLEGEDDLPPDAWPAGGSAERERSTSASRQDRAS